MTEISSFSKIEPEYVKVVIPISFYVLDENLIGSRLESANFLCPVEYPGAPEFAKMEIPISAYA